MAIGVIVSASSSCATVTSDSPMWPIFPSCCSSTRAPELLGERDPRVDAVQLEEVDGVDPEPAQAQLACCFRYSGNPSTCHWPGPVRVNPAFVAMTRSSG